MKPEPYVVEQSVQVSWDALLELVLGWIDGRASVEENKAKRALSITPVCKTGDIGDGDVVMQAGGAYE